MAHSFASALLFFLLISLSSFCSAGEFEPTERPMGSGVAVDAATLENPWRKVQTPTSSSPESIGSYAEGCLRGAQPLPESGEGYQTMHPSRHRLFGHPDLVAFINEFAKQMHAPKADAKVRPDILIGDMGQPRGGPTLSGHASHQTGLDVDIWLWQPPVGKVLTTSERETISSTSYVVEDFERLENTWNDGKLELLKTAALSKHVQRIFINPVIKRQACHVYPGQSWLEKLRPWWNHDDHFHVRLACPQGNSSCEAQAPPPAGTGCDASLDDWFTAETRAKAKQMREHPTPSEMPTLPAACKKVLTEN